MTLPEIEEEVRYRVQERLGILCDGKLPTPGQVELAQREADAWRDSLPFPGENYFV